MLEKQNLLVSFHYNCKTKTIIVLKLDLQLKYLMLIILKLLISKLYGIFINKIKKTNTKIPFTKLNDNNSKD